MQFTVSNASWLPGEESTLLTPHSLGSKRYCLIMAVATKIQLVSSMEPDASDSPSDESFTVLTQRVCAGRFPRASFELMSQTYKVKSSDPAANELPSGER